MINDELRAKIRRLFFAEHWKLGTIATELGVHHETVRAAVEADRFVRLGAFVRPSLLDTYKAFLQETLEKHPRLRSTRLFEMLRPRGYSGSVVQLRRYVRRVRPGGRAEAFLRRTTLAGEEAQVDWAHFGKLRIGRAERPLSCFVLVLSWSRALYARFALDQTLESFVRGHVRAFEALGGVPRAILYDNLKSVVLERDGEHVRFHPRVLELAGHYHFVPKPCAPYRGNEKGKVERTIHYLRHSFFAARTFHSLDDLNAQLATWIADVAHRRTVPTDPAQRLVVDAWAEERARLLSLPEHPFESDLVRPIVSGKTPYVRFDLNDYSIPHTLVRKALTLVASESRVRVLDATTVVADHDRSYGRGEVVEDAAHLAALAKEKRHARELRGRDLLRARCPHADAFFEELSRRGEPLASHSHRLRQLLDLYGPAALDAAIDDALSRGAVSADSVTHLLDQRARRRGPPTAVPVLLPDDPRVRNLTVEPHALEAYDALSTVDDEEEPS